MAKVRSVDFLPEIFQTDTNRQFLAATLDMLVQEPKFKKSQGFIGRTVGPGVNPSDRYIVEPDRVRADYQLEPGVICLEENPDRIKEAITYPGMQDAISFQGGNGNRADRLYQSDYYTWDPFVEFDSLVNFSQYYWLPNGPDPVTVAATGIPVSNDFTVTRANGVYTFSGVAGNTPLIELVRGGNYTFRVSQNTKETVNYRVTNQGTSAYVIDGASNPTLTLVRGNTYVFNLTLRGLFPFWIKILPTQGVFDAYSQGVIGNGNAAGLITFVVPQDAPDTLYYVSQNQPNMQGVFNIVNGQSGTGPGFWIQTDPGLSGTLEATPNISSRTVMGVSNNGEDLGTISFNVPSRTAQQFYYDLAQFTVPVDLVTDFRFNQINNQPLNEVIQRLQAYDMANFDSAQTSGSPGSYDYNPGPDVELTEFARTGIDGVTYLENRTLIFLNVDSGWERTTLFDPLSRDPANNFTTGSFDTTLYDQVLPILPEDRQQLWQINIETREGISFVNLVKVADIPSLSKFTVRYGTVYSNTTWFKNDVGRFEPVPLLTAVRDTFYYQDGTDPDLFGVIRLVDPVQSSTLFVDDILDQTNYQSPNGVEFTNGLKVVFRGDVVPASYGSGTIGIDCSGTSSEFNTIITYSTENLYIGQEILFFGPVSAGLVPGRSYYVFTIVNQFQFSVSAVPGGMAVPLSTATVNFTATAINYREYYVSGVGTAIKLLPVSDFVVVESYAGDSSDFVVVESYAGDSNDSTLAVEPLQPDYITIDRASRDLNAWTRSNRWFHIDVITATAAYNNTVIDVRNESRAKRPILQFRPGIRLFNMGTEGKQPVDIIDLSQTDAFSNVQGATSYTINGYSFVNGTRVIFGADQDPAVKNKIWVVEFIVPDTVFPLIAQPVINLTLAPDGITLVDQSVISLNPVLFADGTQATGNTFWFTGVSWVLAQRKESVNQAPLFDVYDDTEISFGDRVKYPSTNFQGSKLFSYAVSDPGVPDAILEFPLRYLNVANIGDIVFENNLYRDQFVYTRDNVSVTLPISLGTTREYRSRTQYQRLLGWQRARTQSLVYQQFKFINDGTLLQLDIRAEQRQDIPPVKVYVESTFVSPGDYTVTRGNDSTTIAFDISLPDGAIIEVLILSDQVSKTGFYRVPINLENNPLNANSRELTLGTIRTHYQGLCENLTELQGPISGANNSRDLGNLVPYGLTILQQSSPLTLAGYFLRSAEFNIFDSLIFNNQEYIKYKNQILQSVTEQELQFQTAAQILDQAIESVTAGRVQSQPFYWSDMIPSGAVFTQTNYTVTITTTNTFNTLQIYDYHSANYRGLNVYLNDRILLRGRDYVVATDGARITVLISMSLGDVLTLREYSETYGNFCPNTPTKLGLYPAWEPRVAVERTSTGEQTVIVGHDGSITKPFDDIRDEVLLEFERRIYNNLKLDGNPVPLTISDVLPGEFRDTGYSLEEIQTILNEDFLSYVAWNKLDYRAQEYRANNEFTYNYSQATSKINNVPLPGAWRGINRYFYDTQQPQLTPWEMLGFTVEPAWWTLVYGSAPYTQDNLVLWDDLAQGLVRDPQGSYILSQYARPGLQQVIPTDSQGQLQSPLTAVVGTFDAQQFRRSWSLGDGGPVEASWWNSSSYPFAVMRLLALTRPAKFFALFVDRDLYRYSEEYRQFLYDDRYRLDANGVQVYGNGVSKAGYLDWIVDYNRQSGLDSTQDLTNDLSRLDVRLCYRMAAFSDKQYIKLYTEKSSPNSENTSFLIPDENYQLLLYKNQPFDRAVYSAVIVQRVPGGYAVYGYSTAQPFFTVFEGQTAGTLVPITVSGKTVRVPARYTAKALSIPYGFIFADENSVSDFLLGYGEYLELQGLSFTNTENGYQLDWKQMVVEFLYWSQQGWDDNSVIVLNPLASRLSIERSRAVVDNINIQTTNKILLDQNRRALPVRNLNIVRLNNIFTVEPLDDRALSFIDLTYTSYEHMIVLNNVSLFGDLIYDPVTVARQSRLNIIAISTAEWNGQIDTPGFILNQNTVEEWNPTQRYSKGEIVLYKDSYWSAATIVQPSEYFNFSDWVQSDYEQIELGLLPNLANKANQIANSYNINQANLETDNDLLSYGLIGFRPRQYMTALQLDDVSQVNVYRQFLDTKGTILSAELLARARLGKESADYQIYENWAVQRAVYGANANRSFFELRLNRALLTANPSTIQVIQSEQSSLADQTILLSDIWRQSYRLTSTDILPTTTVAITDTALPSAGYVSLDDVDVTVFDLDDRNALSTVIDQINLDTKIWVARINDYDWNVYRVGSVPGNISHCCDNLDGTSLVIFTEFHGLVIGQQIIIKYFDTLIDGVYTVLSIPSLSKITIGFRFLGDQTVVNGAGIGFVLETMRVTQLSDIINLPYANQIQPGARVWADNNGDGRWTVVEKQQVFVSVTQLEPKILDTQSGYGSSVSQATDRFAALVGSPSYFESVPAGNDLYGAVYVYVRGHSEVYQPVSPANDRDAVLYLNTPGTRGFGNAVEFGNRSWAAAGASASLGEFGTENYGYVNVIHLDTSDYTPGSNPYIGCQVLVNPDDTDSASEFGYSLAMSLDERWLYVGAPGANRVYAYGLVIWQDQFVRTTMEDSTVEFDIAGQIQIDNENQVEVLIDNTLQTLNVDYTVSADFSTITIVDYVENGELVIQRRKDVSLDPAAGPTYANIGQYFFTVATAENLYSFSIEVVKEYNIVIDGIPTKIIETVQQRPNIDYEFGDGSSLDLTFKYAFGPEVQQINLRAQGYWQFVDSLAVPDLPVDARFGHSVSTSTDGRQVMVGAPYHEVNQQDRAGSVYVFDRNVQRFIYGQESSTVDFTLLGSVTEPVAVTVNGQFLISQSSSVIDAPNSFTVFYNSYISSWQVRINADLAVGDVIEIETNQFRLLQALAQESAEEFAEFGTSTDLCSTNCSLYIGAPSSSVQVYKGGVVERWVNQATVYGTISATNAPVSLTPGHTLRVNDIDVAVPAAPNNTPAGLAASINSQVPNVSALIGSGGRMTINVINLSATVPDNRVEVLPGTIGTVFDDLGFELFARTQTILNPYAKGYAGFGYSLSVSDTTVELAVGTPSGTMYFVALFDDGNTDFDGAATDFFSETVQSGTVLIYNFFPSANASLSNPGQFVFGQQITTDSVAYLDKFGQSVDYTSGLLWIGSPGFESDDLQNANTGRVYLFDNPGRLLAWVPLHTQQPVVDVRLLNSIFLYNRITSATTEFLDFFDPLQGKILGAARQNIDYIGSVDPAFYNIGSAAVRSGTTWGSAQVGEVWWDISSVRFIDPNQDNTVYAARRWGQPFPGSTVDVYQWIVSPVPPANYPGPGTVRDIINYSVNTVLSSSGIISTEYFFWVQGISLVSTAKGKTLSVDAVARYIENPQATGISYLAPINASTVAIYNCENLLEAADTILHIEYDREFTADNVHVEYELIAQDRPDGFLSDNLYRKLQDSLCGVDVAGNLVPDMFLSPPERYGVQFRPRQSMFVNRFLSLQNYVTSTNTVLAQFPISETRSFNLLNSRDPEPTAASGQWDRRVATLEVLGFQVLTDIPIGFRYLVSSDESQQGRWTIYEVVLSLIDNTVKTFQLVLVQNYYTPDYWSYINWYLPGYNFSIRPVLEVPNVSSLDTITVPVGSSVKVTANGRGKFEIYRRGLAGFDRVGLEDGTIEISPDIYDYAAGRFGFDVEVFDTQYFDQEPVIETRKIVQAINQELFVDDLLIERNRLLMLMFDYVLSESVAPEWLVKTSLIDVDHRIRELLPFQNYVRDNQEFVIDYIQEVKPYHVQVREFNLTYSGQNNYEGSLVDFDVPAYFDTALTLPQFVSPILLPYEAGTAQVSNFLSDVASTAAVWQQWPWSQWIANHLLVVDLVIVPESKRGSGYTDPPQIIIVGDAAVPATAVAVINASGQMIAINVTSRGSGYRSTPTVEISGGNGTGAEAYAVLIGQGLAQDFSGEIVTAQRSPYNLVRSIKTVIKYDRYQYVSTVVIWRPDAVYENGTLVRHLDRVWRADNTAGGVVVGPDFDLEYWQPVPASALSGADRTMGFYVAGVDSPGLELPLLIDGISYPGVQVQGNPLRTQDERPLDVIYRSSFKDLFLGLDPTDINVDGGEFIGSFEGHAPEELINGSEFDTVDIKVFTRPGSDWQGDGHGFQIGAVNTIYKSVTNFSWSWAGVLKNPAALIATNQSTGTVLTQDLDYVVDWSNQTISIVPGRVGEDQLVNTMLFEVGGGSQLYRTILKGNDVEYGIFYVPVNTAEIQNVVVFVDGQVSASPTWEPWIASQPWSLNQSYDQNTVVNNAGIYYRSTRAVIPGIEISNLTYWLPFVPTLMTQVTMPTEPSPESGLTVVVMGYVTVPVGNLIIGRQYTIQIAGSTDWSTVGAPDSTPGTVFTAQASGTGSGTAITDYEWSSPQIQYQIVDSEVLLTQTIPLVNSLSGTNSVNMIVTLNGLRLQPPAGIRWSGDGSTTDFGLPQRLGTSFSQSSISATTDIAVWVNDIFQTQSIGSVVGDYSVTNWDGSNVPGRQVVFAVPPPLRAEIVITVSTLSQYSVAGNSLEISPLLNLGDIISIITFNDTSQQGILTTVFNGPVIANTPVIEGYDYTDFDVGLITGGAGSFDYSSTSIITTNQFDLYSTGFTAGRLWVTLDGVKQYEGLDYTIQGQYLILASGTIGLDQSLVVTQFTESIVPASAAFRIFQDMRGTQATYRITPSSTTQLARPLLQFDSEIRVVDASALTEPNLNLGIFGEITVNSERITYRVRDLASNRLTGLRRGTAGTAAADHAVGSAVYDIGRGNLLTEEYQNYVVSDTTVADGSITVYYAPNIEISDFGDSSSIYVESIEVYVGGTRQYRFGDTTAVSQYRWIVTDFDPLAIEFIRNEDPLALDPAPPAGVEVTILQRRALGWYGPGVRQTNGLALQETNTVAARFLTGR
jgi:hypothetical protein